MYAQGKRGQAKVYTICTGGRETDTFKYVNKEVPFCMYFVIFSYARYFYHTLQSLVMTFITVLQNICYDYFPVSQVFYCHFFIELLIGYFKNSHWKWRGQMGKSMYAMGEGL